MLDNKAIQCKSLQILKINDADNLILETRDGRVTATNHCEQFNIDLFREHQQYVTDERNDKTRQEIIMGKTDLLEQTLFYKDGVVSPEKISYHVMGS